MKNKTKECCKENIKLFGSHEYKVCEVCGHIYVEEAPEFTLSCECGKHPTIKCSPKCMDCIYYEDFYLPKTMFCWLCKRHNFEGFIENKEENCENAKKANHFSEMAGKWYREQKLKTK